MIVFQHDINSLARSRQPDNLGVVTSVSIPSVPLRPQPSFPWALKEIGTYQTGSGLAAGGNATTAVLGGLVALAVLALLWVQSQR